MFAYCVLTVDTFIGEDGIIFLIIEIAEMINQRWKEAEYSLILGPCTFWLNRYHPRLAKYLAAGMKIFAERTLS